MVAHSLSLPAISPSRAELRAALTLAETHHLSLHDAAYASVARERGATLATMDRALLKAGLGLMPSQVIGLAVVRLDNGEGTDEVTGPA